MEMQPVGTVPMVRAFLPVELTRGGSRKTMFHSG
jgi:hypothetical protein